MNCNDFNSPLKQEIQILGTLYNTVPVTVIESFNSDWESKELSPLYEDFSILKIV
jgi:hypothetical protein